MLKVDSKKRATSKVVAKKASKGKDSKATTTTDVNVLKRFDQLDASKSRVDVVHFSWSPGLVLGPPDSKYTIVSLLGDGSFGRVLLAEDRQRKQVAIKVTPKADGRAQIEANLLRSVCEWDKSNRSKCMQYYSAFFHNEQYFCLVGEVLGYSLYEVLRLNGLRGFFLQDIKSVAQQCLKGLEFLHSTHITHTDLKTPNILFRTIRSSTDFSWLDSSPRGPGHWKPQVSSNVVGSASHALDEATVYGSYGRPRNLDIKLVDFGNAMRDDEDRPAIISTLPCRAPEVILQTGWNKSADLWSMGCILAEMYIGSMLFDVEDGSKLLPLIELTLKTVMPDTMVDKLDRILLDTEKRILMQTASFSERHTLRHLILPRHNLFFVLLHGLLEVEASHRLSASAALNTVFITSRSVCE